jgi:two-component system cell cycle sensor histidine kinase/response regulator CckA
LPQGSREHRNVGTIRDAAERARDLVKNILAFSRKEAPTRGSVDLLALIQRSLELLRPVIPSTIRIEERIESVPLLLADPDQLHQLLFNLVANAAQAIGDQHGGTISIELVAAHDTQPPQNSLPPSNSSVRLSVRDTGRGLDEATMKHIFDPFFTTKAVGQGTGLGLSVVHGIVAQHGGRIAVESRLGRGTCFHVYLPLFTSNPAHAETEQSPPEVASARH